MVGGRGRVQGVVESYKPKKNRKDFDRCLECEDKIEKSMIRQAMWERDSSASFWYEVNGMDMIGGEEEREGGDGSGDEVGGNPLLNNSFSLEAAGRADTESSKTTRKSRGY
jgi:hypothetical protein